MIFGSTFKNFNIFIYFFIKFDVWACKSQLLVQQQTLIKHFFFPNVHHFCLKSKTLENRKFEKEQQ